MNIKIQGGGGGSYSNSGSCSDAVGYLEHEDLDRAMQGKAVEPFFNHQDERVKSSEIIGKIDRNKGQLHKDEAKFFVITISPSSEELKKMGDTPEEQSQAMKNYIKNDFANQYAENFNKNLSKENLMYYSKIHIERKGNNENDMHAHIVISRKTADNKQKISPMTNHRGTSKGAVKGGFDRTEFFRKMENSFDKRFEFDRNVKNSFDYQNAMKNGSFSEMDIQIKRALDQERKILQGPNIAEEKKQGQKVIQEQVQNEDKKSNGMKM